MADFLAKLVGRTLGGVPAAQPLIAPLYASVAAPPDLISLEPVQNRVSINAKPTPATTNEWSEHPVLDQTTPVSVIETQAQGNTALLVASHTATETAQRVAGEPGQQAFLPMPQERTRAVQADQPALRPPSEIVWPNTSKITKGNEGQTELLVPTEGGKPASTDQVVTIKPSAIDLLQPVPGRATAPAEQRRTNAITQQNPVPPIPTIQVTIGRIEVRATPPPTKAPARKANTVPSMSLEDYLRADKGGNR